MKKITTIILLAIISLTQQDAMSQVWMSWYGMRTNGTSTLVSPDIGGGFGMNFISDGISLTGGSPVSAAKKLASPSSLDPNSSVNPNAAPQIQTCLPNQKTGIQLHLGGDFFFSGLGHRNFYNVPLIMPQQTTGKVTISNSVWGMDMLARFSIANKSIFTPYVDFFAGYRGMYSNVAVIPMQYNGTYGRETDQMLTSLSGLNYGMGAGLMTSLTKRIRLDLGVSFAEAIQKGHVADLSSAYSDQNGMNLNWKTAPSELMMVRAGIMIYLCDGGSDKDEDCDCNCKSHKNYSRSSSSSWGRSSWGGGSWGGGGGHSSVGVHIGGGGLGGVRIK